MFAGVIVVYLQTQFRNNILFLGKCKSQEIFILTAYADLVLIDVHVKETCILFYYVCLTF